MMTNQNATRQTSPYWIRETFVNVDRDAIFGQGDWIETSSYTLGDLYRSLRAEYGACTGKQYSERVGKPDVQSGWVFRKRMKYEDSNDTYIREVWVSVSTTAPQLRMTNITRPWEVSHAS